MLRSLVVANGAALELRVLTFQDALEMQSPLKTAT
jgi:hypothetical protein